MGKKKKQKKDPLITKFQKYKSTPIEDLKARKEINITKDDFKELLKKTRINPDLESLYDECRNIEWADFVHKKSKEPISKIRDIVNRIETKSYDKGKKKIKETRIFTYWPSMIITARDIFIGNNERIIEAELLFPKENPDFDKIPWQEYAVEMLQFFKDKPDLVSSPPLQV